MERLEDVYHETFTEEQIEQEAIYYAILNGFVK